MLFVVRFSAVSNVCACQNGNLLHANRDIDHVDILISPSLYYSGNLSTFPADYLGHCAGTCKTATKMHFSQQLPRGLSWKWAWRRTRSWIPPLSCLLSAFSLYTANYYFSLTSWTNIAYFIVSVRELRKLYLSIRFVDVPLHFQTNDQNTLCCNHSTFTTCC